MEKLTDKVRAAIDDKTISESAALAMSNMTAAEQDACLEKIISGNMRRTAQDIQTLSASKVVEKDVQSENVDGNLAEPVSEGVSLPFESEMSPSSESTIGKLIDVPEKFEALRKEAEDWFYHQQLEILEAIYTKAKRLSEKDDDELQAAQWAMRASVARYNIDELKLRHIETELVKP